MARKSPRATRSSRSARKGTSTTARKTRRTAPARKQAAPPERRKQTPETLRLRSFEPSITVADIERSIRFYTEVLGFIVGERWKGDDGVLRGAMLRAGACSLGLSQDDWSKGRDRKKGEGVRIWCTTAQDVDAIAKRIQSAGGRLTEGPMTQSWGARSLSIDDPDGFHISIYAVK